ncbi:MAG TPA: hypothetical protein VNH18_01400 [Bryobacteraceae bacterium]|nr:hypothetical protein [Bryobacteraceae bacterium]
MSVITGLLGERGEPALRDPKPVPGTGNEIGDERFSGKSGTHYPAGVHKRSPRRRAFPALGTIPQSEDMELGTGGTTPHPYRSPK